MCMMACLLHVRTVERQRLPFLSNTRTQQWNNGVMNSLLGNGSVNTLPRRSYDNRIAFSALSVQRLYNASPHLLLGDD
jgi:hypothetical protein